MPAVSYTHLDVYKRPVAAGTDVSAKTVGEAQLVNASAQSSDPKEETSSDAAGSEDPTEGKTAEEYFSETRLSRQKSRDEAVELLEDVLQDAKTSEEAKKMCIRDRGNNEAAPDKAETFRGDGENIVAFLNLSLIHIYKAGGSGGCRCRQRPGSPPCGT